MSMGMLPTMTQMVEVPTKMCKEVTPLMMTPTILKSTYLSTPTPTPTPTRTMEPIMTVVPT